MLLEPVLPGVVWFEVVHKATIINITIEKKRRIRSWVQKSERLSEEAFMSGKCHKYMMQLRSSPRPLVPFHLSLLNLLQTK